MSKKVSAVRASRDVRRNERSSVARENKNTSAARGFKNSTLTQDSFQNFGANIGIGTDNISSFGTYGFNPITREKIKLEWVHRGSWIAACAIDMPAEDMTREGVEITGEGVKPEVIEQIEEMATALEIWSNVEKALKWGDLYGGCICVMMVQGQDYSTPLRLDTIGKGQFKGVFVLDRWHVRPSVNDLVTEEGPFLGQPKFYTVDESSPGLRGYRVHYTRILRLIGIDMPYDQTLTENLWGESKIERLYDRLLAFDSATAGAAQLVYKAHYRVMKFSGFRDAAAEGGDIYQHFSKFMSMLRTFQTLEGITAIDTDDEFVQEANTSFSGLAEALVHFGQQLSGAMQVPLVRLFGQSPAGLNSTGESDLRTYYDNILRRQKRQLHVFMTKIYRALFLNLGIDAPKGFRINFRPLWILSETEKAAIATQDTNMVITAVEGGLATLAKGMEELRSRGKVSGRWQVFTDEDVKEAEELDNVPMAEKVEVAAIRAGDPVEGVQSGNKTPEKEAVN